MPTNRTIESALMVNYPKSMKHMQQLLMLSEACAKNYGKKSIFGKDKFEPRMEKFLVKTGQCIRSLHQDGHVANPDDMSDALVMLNDALNQLKMAYSNWPLAFQFWDAWYQDFKEKA